MANSHRPSLGETRARQGRRGLPMLWVLVIGMALVASQPYATQPSQAAAFKAPPPSAASRQNYDKGGPLAPKGGNPSNPPS